MIQSKENWNIHHSTVSALRLDVVLKEMIRKSRSIAKQLIEKTGKSESYFNRFSRFSTSKQ